MTGFRRAEAITAGNAQLMQFAVEQFTGHRQSRTEVHQVHEIMCSATAVQLSKRLIEVLSKRACRQTHSERSLPPYRGRRLGLQGARAELLPAYVQIGQQKQLLGALNHEPANCRRQRSFVDLTAEGSLKGRLELARRFCLKLGGGKCLVGGSAQRLEQEL
jgi:hypothetical protein